tara:strand:+ start:3130 stop:3741 length:612 start_codon:yes stop_codon:yes gene_type:complete
MADPGYGSYLFNAAESERNRRTGNQRFQRQLGERQRQFDIQDKRVQTLFDIAMEERDTSKEIAGVKIHNAAEEQRSEKIKDKLSEDDAETMFSNFRTGDIETDEYSRPGGGVKKWWRDEGWLGPKIGEPGYDSAYDPKWEQEIGGVPIDPEYKKLDMTNNDMTLELLKKYASDIESTDIQSGDKSTESLFDIFKKASKMALPF